MPPSLEVHISETTLRIVKFQSTLDYLLRGAIDLLRSYGHEEAAKTLEEYRKQVFDEFNRLEARPS